MTETIATYSVEPSDDRDFTLEEIQAIADGAITSDLTELEQLNLKVAAIAGWTDIEEWHASRNSHPDLKVNKKVFIGKNDRKELGIFIPDYTSDLNAIADVVNRFCFIDGRIYKVTFEPSDPEYGSLGEFRVFSEDIHREYEAYGMSMAKALCDFLIELHPYLKLDPEAIAAFNKING